MKPIITRIAPSPTGKFLHIGNLRTLLYNYFLAKNGPKGSKFLVRLEDTDQDRYTPEFLEHFKNTLDWLGIKPDASYWNPDPKIGSFTQSKRDYSDKVRKLLDKKLAYYAFDSKDSLKALRDEGLKYDSSTRMNMKNSFTMSKNDLDKALSDGIPYVIRFSVTPGINIKFTDQILGDITINSDTLDDKVLVKSNGIGSYHLCNVCDDHDMGVTHVLRGNEWVNSTPLHVLIYKALDWDVPKFAHLPLIMNSNGVGKISKRTAYKFGIPISPLGYVGNDGNYCKGWRDNGYDAVALMNYLALLGWNPGNDVEVMTMDQMIKSFSLDRVHKGGARFDMDKAKWINSQHLKMSDNKSLLPYITIKDDRYSDDKINKIIDLAKDRSDFKSEMNSIVKLFFDDPIITSTNKIDDNFENVFNDFIDKINDIDFDNKLDIKDNIYHLCKDNGTKMGKVMPGLRMALVGGVPGPDLLTTMSILGKSEVIKRIKSAILNKNVSVVN